MPRFRATRPNPRHWPNKAGPWPRNDRWARLSRQAQLTLATGSELVIKGLSVLVVTPVVAAAVWCSVVAATLMDAYASRRDRPPPGPDRSTPGPRPGSGGP